MTDFAMIEAAILGVVEGVTEFIPVSSTGHLILADYLLGFRGPPGNVFEVVIQLGAILAICVLYAARLTRVVVELPRSPRARMFVISILVAFLPAAVLGLLLHDFIKNVLFSPWVVAVTLIIGGVAILLIERRSWRPRYHESENLPPGIALAVGFFQTLALVPGVSRSGATILGAMLVGVDRRAAAEFSFFLAIPTMLGATVLDLYKNRDALAGNDLLLIGIGFICALITAIIVVRAFLAYLTRHTFEVFGWYRIFAGAVMILVLLIYGTTPIPQPG